MDWIASLRISAEHPCRRTLGFNGRFPQVRSNRGELVQRGLQVFGDFGCNYVRIGQICCVLKTLVFQPEDIQAGFVALHEIVVGERAKTLGFFAFVPVLGVVAADEVVEMLALQRICLQREVLIRSKVVDSELVSPRLFARRFTVEEQDVRLDALGIEDAGRQAQ